MRFSQLDNRLLDFWIEFFGTLASTLGIVIQASNTGSLLSERLGYCVTIPTKACLSQPWRTIAILPGHFSLKLTPLETCEFLCGQSNVLHKRRGKYIIHDPYPVRKVALSLSNT
jgi:hypothetical protein